MRNVLAGFPLFVLFCIIMMSGYATLDLLTTHISNFFATMMQARATPDIQLTNPLKDVTMNEPKADTPTPTEAPKEPPLISSTTTGAGEEFDCTKTLNRPLTWWEKKLAEKARNIALSSGWKYAPLEDADKIGTHAMTVVVKGAEARKLAGIYYRDTPLEEWEKQLARTLLELARENGSEEK